MTRRRILLELTFRFFAIVVAALLLTAVEPVAQPGVSAPVLKWQYGGCSSGPSCATGWYSSPAVADLDGDGQPDVIWGAYDVVALNGANGSLKWRAPSPNRVWPGVAVADLTGDGTLEVIVGRDSDQLTVYNRFGSVVWTRNPFGDGELRAMAVADLENDGRLDIIVGNAGWTTFQLNAFDANGNVRTGWPARHSGDPGFGDGLWNANVAVGDMNGDGFKEVFGPTGSHSITGLDRNGNQLRVNAIFDPSQFWSEVGTHVDQAVDVRGWANCGVEHRPDFASSAAVIADVDGDGTSELIVVGNVYNCGTSPYTDLYHMPFIFKADHTRWSGSGFDWTVIPTPRAGSAPRSEDYEVIESAVPNAVVADLDGDGIKEILYPSYDGRVHAFWLDKTEHGNWPYTIPSSGASGDDFRFAGEPVVADLDNDGRAEVIFTSWPKKSTGRVGQLHVLDYQGSELYRIDLPAPANGATWNGGLAAPTIANIDSDPDLELVVGTTGSGVVAYDLPNTANARVLWGTGRGNYGRTGVPVTTAAAPPADTTAPTASIASPADGGVVRASFAVTASASDNVGVVGVQFLVDGVPLGAEATTAPYSVTWDTTTASNSAHALTARARDAAGNVATSAAATVTVDNALPAVTIVSPAGGATVGGSLTVTASASDNAGVAGVQFFLDAAALGAEDATAPYSATWNTTTAANGSQHTLTARARDAAGNATTSSTVTVTVSNTDTSPPTVSETSPAAGTTVSGTIPITADAADNVGVVGVTFFVDTAQVGPEDTASPFLTTWDTTKVTDGSHALTARARDAAGNTATAAAVTVTVSNAAAAPAGTARRFEDTDLAIVYTPGTTLPLQPMDWWHGSRSRGWSAGTASFNRSPGARASFTFTGTSIRWIGFRAPWAGIANVFMDGSLVTQIDLYSTVEEVQSAVFSAANLVAGSHTLVVESTGQRNPASVDWAVVVDAFDVTPSSPPTVNGTRLEESTSSVAYTAGWTQGDTGQSWSGNTAATSAVGGARATVTFTGMAVDWVGLRGPATGIARVYLDGAFQIEVDTFSASEVQDVLYSAVNLAAASHTLTIEATGFKRAGSSDSLIVVDAFDVRSRFEETDPSVIYGTGWTQSENREAFSGTSDRTGSGTAAFSEVAGAQATFTVKGTSVNWIGSRGPTRGIARVFLDGALVATVDTYAAAVQPQAVLYAATDLADATHTLTIEATGSKNANAARAWIIVDAFDATVSSPAPPVTRVQETDAAIAWTAGWTLGNRFTLRSGENARLSTTAGAQATFTFTGRAVRWISEREFNGGIARVYLDGAFVTEVDTYAPLQEEFQSALFSAANLTTGAHTLTIEVTGLKNPASSGTQIVVDAFDIY